MCLCVKNVYCNMFHTLAVSLARQNGTMGKVLLSLFMDHSPGVGVQMPMNSLAVFFSGMIVSQHPGTPPGQCNHISRLVSLCQCRRAS